MSETFLVLLAAGGMLAAFISDPREVTVNWLRLAGIIALAMTALSGFFLWRREQTNEKDWLLYALVFGAILLQIGGIHLPQARMGRPFALVAAVGGILLGERLAVGKGSSAALMSVS